MSEVTRLLTLTDCAEITGTTERFWRRMVQEKRIRVIKVGKFVRISEADLSEYLTNRAREADNPLGRDS